ncbi:hypothetical protein [Cryobacterium sp. TMT1-66-1]|uniref:hypothetical protein n=1 Tax=Cryobacterium sp. TMT1-66-1 TaxID=1259242 RepID=UPI00106B842C|nr:hypothetical protein [Cryobacterium sp. TMT1-66-1]TFD04149.1 hypothetical protein E3T29_15965 [Cryobacterium sp. TMT1-66-1]
MTETTVVNSIKFFRSLHRVVRDQGYYRRYEERKAARWVSSVNELIHCGYGWAVLNEDAWGEHRVTEFATNHYGEGLWEDDQRTLGTCDLRLHGDRRRIRRVVLPLHFPAY